MDLIQFFEQNFTVFILACTRVSGIFITAPIFSSRNIPPRVKIMLSVFISLIIVPVILQKYTVNIPSALLPYMFAVLCELTIGVTIGLVMEIFFAVIQVAGQMLDTQIGFGIVNVLDPQSGTQVPLLGNFIQVIFIIVFLATDMHHLFFSALADSFQVLPINGAVFDGSLALFILKLVSDMFVLALKIAMPIVMTTLLVDISMGMLARTMPQMNVFVVGIPLKLAVGIFMLSVVLPTYIYILKVACRELFANIYKLLSIFGG